LYGIGRIGDSKTTLAEVEQTLDVFVCFEGDRSQDLVSMCLAFLNTHSLGNDSDELGVTLFQVSFVTPPTHRKKPQPQILPKCLITAISNTLVSNVGPYNL